MNKLTEFLDRNDACREGLSRLAATGAATPDEAWERADARDLVWAVTRPGVMSSDQRRRFLAEAVLAPIEHLLTDERSKNILQKLRTNERVTQEDKDAAQAAARAAAASWAAEAYAADAEAAADAACSAADAAYAEADAAWAAAYAAASSAEDAADAARADAAADAAEEAAYAAADAADARDAQARWIRENFALSYLNIN